MDFLRRILSVGSKRHRRKSRNIKLESKQDLGSIQDEDQEAIANRLLRSASARLAVSGPDCSFLPPLGERPKLRHLGHSLTHFPVHPINNVLITPTASTTSLSSTVQRGTYTVTIHKKRTHPSRTTPAHHPPNSTRLSSEPSPSPKRHLGFRSDPSVASLLDMYDAHGHLDSKVFSNTPEKESRAQTRRSGSTLRQLLGATSSIKCKDTRHDSALEGDISWAERYLE
jgi:hypothetical protein